MTFRVPECHDQIWHWKISIVLIDFNNSSLEGKISGVYKFPYTHPLDVWKYTRVADMYACGLVTYELVNEIYCEKRSMDVSIASLG